MVIFEQTLRKLLIASNLVADRVFLMAAPQAPNAKLVLPYIVFFHVGPIPHTTQHGPLKQIQRDYQVSVFDESQSRALAIGDSMRQWLNTFHGAYENVVIGSAHYMTQTWLREDDTALFQVIQEYRIIFHYSNQTAVSVRSNKRSSS